MNKAQAIQAMIDGQTLTHTYFTPEEWVKLGHDNLYIFEDGCRCTYEEFWTGRTDDYWNKGWKVYNDN